MRKKVYIIEVYKDGKDAELTGVHTIVASTKSEAALKAVDYLYFSQIFGLVKHILVKDDNGKIIDRYTYDEESAMLLNMIGE